MAPIAKSNCFSKTIVWFNLGLPREEPKGPKGSAVLSTEGRVVGPCWEKLKPKGLNTKAKMLSLQSFLRKGVSLVYVGRNYNLKDLKESKGKGAGLCCGSRLRSGEVFAYVGLIHNLKDIKT